MFGAFPWGKIWDRMTGRKPNTVTDQYQLIMIKPIYHSCTYISMHMPVKDKIILNKIST